MVIQLSSRDRYRDLRCTAPGHAPENAHGRPLHRRSGLRASMGPTHAWTCWRGPCREGVSSYQASRDLCSRATHPIEAPRPHTEPSCM